MCVIVVLLFLSVAISLEFCLLINYLFLFLRVSFLQSLVGFELALCCLKLLTLLS